MKTASFAKNNAFKQFCAVLLIGSSSLTWAQTEMSSRASTLERSNKPFQTKVVSADRSELVFIRPSGADVGAVSLSVDGQYHTSLVAGAYSSLCMKAGSVNVELDHVQTGRSDVDGGSTTFKLKPGTTHYFVISDSGRRRFAISELSAVQVRELLASVTTQPHTVSRVKSAVVCNDPTVAAPVPAPEPAPAAPKVVAAPVRTNFAGDSLFAFGRSGIQDMTVGGRAALDRFIDALPSQYASIEKIDIIGFADPIGNADLNQRLSEQRASAVRSYLVQRGVPNTVVTASGRGSSELVVTGCPTLGPTAAVCNAPNRRVVIDVVGIRK